MALTATQKLTALPLQSLIGRFKANQVRRQKLLNELMELGESFTEIEELANAVAAALEIEPPEPEENRPTA